MLPSADSGQPSETEYVEPEAGAVADAQPAEPAEVVQPEYSTHPAADRNQVIIPMPELGKYYIGDWNGHPNYGCPVCGYATLEGPSKVEDHILFKIDQGSNKHLEWLEKEDKA